MIYILPVSPIRLLVTMMQLLACHSTIMSSSLGLGMLLLRFGMLRKQGSLRGKKSEVICRCEGVSYLRICLYIRMSSDEVDVDSEVNCVDIDKR